MIIVAMNIKDFIIVQMPPPHDRLIWVKELAIITKNDTGEKVEYETEAIWDSEESRPSTSNWEYGNFSCDCNRANWFGDDDETCGEDRFSVTLINPKTGLTYYDELVRFTSTD